MAVTSLKQIRVGSKILVRGSWGSDPAVEAIVDELERNIKNGCAGVDYTIISNKKQHWAYLDQIDCVLKY